MWTCTRCSKFLGFVTFFIDHNMILHRNSAAFCGKQWYSLWFSWISLFFASSIWAVFFVKFEFRAGFGTTERVFFLQAIWFKIWAVLSARQPFMECSQRRCQHLTYVQTIGLKRPFFSVFTLGGMALFNIFQIPSIVPVCTFNTPDLRPCICDKSHIARTHLSFTSSFYTNNCIEPHLCLCTEPHVLTECVHDQQL